MLVAFGWQSLLLRGAFETGSAALRSLPVPSSLRSVSELCSISLLHTYDCQRSSDVC